MTVEELKASPIEALEKRYRQIQQMIENRAADQKFWFVPGFRTGLIRVLGVVKIYGSADEIAKLTVYSAEQAAVLGIDAMVTETVKADSLAPATGFYVRHELDTETIDAMLAIHQQIAIELGAS